MKKSFGEKKASRPVSRILSWCGHSSGRVVSFPLLRPTRNGASDAEVPVWPCSERGLPCRPRCLGRGALLPHHFTLAVRKTGFRLGRYVFCGAFRRLAAPGCCPAFLLFGVRTFLPFAPCRREKAAARPTRLRGIIALIRRTVDGKFFWEVSVVPNLCFASLIDSSDSGFSSAGGFAKQSLA